MSPLIPTLKGWARRRTVLKDNASPSPGFSLGTKARLRNMRSSETQRIGKQPIGPRHTGGQLPEEAQPRVHVGAPAQRRDQERTLELRARAVVGFEQRHVGRVPVVREVEAALLHPLAPV